VKYPEAEEEMREKEKINPIRRGEGELKKKKRET